MNEINDTLVCTSDGCVVTSRPATVHPANSLAPSRPLLNVKIVSDIICPWCWIGKRRFEKAINLLGDKADVLVTWKPFQLNPSMGRDGMDRERYRLAKFGSLEKSRLLDQQLTAAAATDGIEFHLDQINRTPNTLDAHRLIWLARLHDKQDAVVEELFKAYFSDGVDIGRRSDLISIATAAGIDAGVAVPFFAGTEGEEQVLTEEKEYKSLGISGVPSYIVNDHLMFSGALQPADMVQAFEQALDRHD
jgi:predicted DsbA family dithiol-disulfide isomerase